MLLIAHQMVFVMVVAFKALLAQIRIILIDSLSTLTCCFGKVADCATILDDCC